MIPTTGGHVDLSLIHPKFTERLEQFFNDGRIKGQVSVTSGCRSYAAQKRLYDKYKAGRGNLAANPDWRRPDGFFRGSFHQEQPDGYAYAVDLTLLQFGGISKPEVTRIADKFGIRPTVKSEWWHFQPRDGNHWFANKAFDDDFVKTPVMDWAAIIAWKEAIGFRIGMWPLKRGARGDDVKVVQHRLNAIDFHCGTADGAFGRKTMRAVKQLQRACLLRVDGVVDGFVWQAMWDPQVPNGL